MPSSSPIKVKSATNCHISYWKVRKFAPNSMAPRKVPPSSPIPIGNCEVTVEAHNFTCKSDPKSLEISVPRNTNIKISVREETHKKSSNGICYSKSEANGDEETISASVDDYLFVLINPKYGNDSCSSSYIKEVLSMYTRELPSMSYAANTGKQSTFLEKCVSNGKYCTLLLKSKSFDDAESIIAAITYQIVPADTHFAEIPLAAVRSMYQKKGIGRVLYNELRKRLQSVGVHNVLCWGDKESQGFWLKQGFTSIGEVGTKGRVQRLPIKAGIQRALCFPGGSILMLSHLNEANVISPSEPLKFPLPLKPHEKSSSAADKSITRAFMSKCENILASLGQTVSRTECSQPEVLVKDSFSTENCKLDGLSSDPDSINNCHEPCTFGGDEVVECNMAMDAAKGRGDAVSKHCSCSMQGRKKRVWKSSLSSLMSKKVKGTHQDDSRLGSNWAVVSEYEDGQPKNNSGLGVYTADSLFICGKENNAEEGIPRCMIMESQTDKKCQSNGEIFGIMLMNIADDTKKAHLTKVIENLGGVVISDGSVSTHVVTGKARKTLNFCTALCSGAWIVSPSWLKDSYREGRFVDEFSYLLHDEDYILKYRTELKTAVLKARARPHGLLKEYDICIARHVQPGVATLSAIVRSAGGNIICGLNKVKDTSKTIFLACEENMDEVLSVIKKEIWTFSSDWLINCVMRQELDLEASQFTESL